MSYQVLSHDASETELFEACVAVCEGRSPGFIVRDADGDEGIAIVVDEGGPA